MLLARFALIYLPVWNDLLATQFCQRETERESYNIQVVNNVKNKYVSMGGGRGNSSFMAKAKIGTFVLLLAVYATNMLVIIYFINPIYNKYKSA
jgi:hypothetical protein